MTILMGVPIPGKMVFLLKWGPDFFSSYHPVYMLCIHISMSAMLCDFKFRWHVLISFCLLTYLFILY